jgi:uncharacterized membrane protein YjdF
MTVKASVPTKKEPDMDMRRRCHLNIAAKYLDDVLVSDTEEYSSVWAEGRTVYSYWGSMVLVRVGTYTRRASLTAAVEVCMFMKAVLHCTGMAFYFFQIPFLDNPGLGMG